MKTSKKQVWSKVWTGSIFAALIAAVALFVVMLQMEKKMLSEYEKGTVYVADEAIPKGVVITEQNVEQYLRLEEVDKKIIPKAALQTPDQLVGLVASGNIEEGVLLSEGMFTSRNDITANMEEPVIAGFKAEDLYQVAGGVLRAGDRIHIYTVSESGLAGLIWKNVYVEQAFDSGGTAIKGGDVSSAAQRLNVYMDAKDIERFYTELARGTLRVVKVCDE